MPTSAYHGSAILSILALVLVAVLPARADDPPPVPPGPVVTPAVPMDAGVQLQEVDGRRVIADSQSLAWQRGDERPTVLRVSDISRTEAINIDRINRTRGTYQSYLLAIQPDLPTPLQQLGFTLTLPPPRRHAPVEPGDAALTTPVQAAPDAR